MYWKGHRINGGKEFQITSQKILKHLPSAVPVLPPLESVLEAYHYQEGDTVGQG